VVFDSRLTGVSNWSVWETSPMKIKHVAIIALSALAALIFAPSAFCAHAHGNGSGMHSIHFGKHFRHGHHNNRFNQWAPYGGLYALPLYNYDSEASSAQPANVVYMPGPSRARTCQYVRETVTVPAEGGGTRDVTVTRC